MKKVSFFLLSLFVFSIPFVVLAGNDSFAVEPANPVEKYPSALGYEIKPGDDLQDQIIIKNLSPVDHTYKLFPVDYETSGDHPGLKSDENPGDTIAKWVTLDKSEVFVKANDFAKVGFTLDVPSDVALGNYSGVIIGGIADPVVAKSADAKSTASLAIVARIALKMDVKVTNNPEVINRNIETAQSESSSWMWGLVILLGFILALLVMRLASRKIKNKK